MGRSSGRMKRIHEPRHRNLNIGWSGNNSRKQPLPSLRALICLIRKPLRIAAGASLNLPFKPALVSCHERTDHLAAIALPGRPPSNGHLKTVTASRSRPGRRIHILFSRKHEAA